MITHALSAPHFLSRRSTCYYDQFGNYNCANNGWNNWGRWLLFGLVVAAVILFMFSIWYSARRRRRRGARPFYGTGWMASGGQPAPGYGRPPPPPPGQQGYGYGYGYAPQQEQSVYGMAPREPEQAYMGSKAGAGQEAYAPPAGPPPDRIY